MNKKHPKPKPLLVASVAAVALASMASAGSFTSNFSDPNQLGFTLNGGVRADGFTPYPAIENGYLALTYAENSQQGSIVLDDLDSFQAIESFTARFKLQIGPGSGNPADGVSFCFGPDITSFSNFGEEGTGNGVIVAFDIYDNGGGEAPAIEVKYGGAVIAGVKFAKADMVTSKFEDVSIQVTRSGLFHMGYKGQILFTNLILPNYEPLAGQFGIGARTGGENANQRLDDLTIQTVVAGAPVAPSITAQPQNQTVPEGGDATFSIGYDGSAPLTFQWYKNNNPIAGATSHTLTLTTVPLSDHGAKIKCQVTNAAGTATSQEATLSIDQDNTPPTIVVAKGSTDFRGVVITFSEPVDTVTGGNAGNYTIAGLTVTSAAVLGESVVLVTSQQSEGASYTVVVNNVKDRSVKGNVIAPNSSASFRTFTFMLGRVLHKKYNGFDDGAGGNPENLFNDPRYPNQPDRMDLMTAFEYPADGATRVPADPTRNYFDTLEGYFIPPTTGNYVFFTAGADRWWLYLSTDDSPANLHMIAAEPGGWTDPRYWNTTHDTDPMRHRSDYSEFSTWPEGSTIRLTAGRRYYMLQVHHDPSWSGGDWFAATYKLESEEDPADGTAPRLTGNVVGCYVDPTGSSVTISQQPADLTAQEGRRATFAVVATGTSAYGATLAYQWQRQAPGSATWADLTGATTASYTTAALTTAESGAKYRVVCSVPGVVETSNAATLTVVPDTFPPQIAGAGALASETGATFDVGVSFDEAVTPASAGNIANYSLSAGTISSVTVYPGSPGVVLKASGLTVGNTYTVTVRNVQDPKGNTLTSAEKQFKVSPMKWGVVGGKELGIGNGVLAVAENGFDVYSDAIGEWGTYDEATFVYEEVTGDFDKIVQVEYQDASSQWARAGLIVRDVTNFGVDRATQDAGAAGRYQKVHVNPVTTAMGTAGNNAWEGNRRLATGSATTSAGGGGGPLTYPNTWCRLQRVGDLFTIYRSTDGRNWTQLGTTEFTEPMPARVFVGPEFSPENGNIPEDSGLRGMWLAKFRNYGNYSPFVEPTLSYSNAGGVTVLTYSGVLQSAPAVTGPYTPVAGATSPYTVNKTQPAQFYRAAGQ
ncbi:MAG: immunoglobulin domain-containing protein [Verrucomicrobia bacterium]|nr:immunoglobulin domain-containing protein [Verrucomicrobiota bacterium]